MNRMLEASNSKARSCFYFVNVVVLLFVFPALIGDEQVEASGAAPPFRRPNRNRSRRKKGTPADTNTFSLVPVDEDGSGEIRLPQESPEAADDSARNHGSGRNEDNEDTVLMRIPLTEESLAAHDRQNPRRGVSRGPKKRGHAEDPTPNKVPLIKEKYELQGLATHTPQSLDVSFSANDALGVSCYSAAELTRFGRQIHLFGFRITIFFCEREKIGR